MYNSVNKDNNNHDDNSTNNNSFLPFLGGHPQNENELIRTRQFSSIMEQNDEQTVMKKKYT